MKKKSMFKAVKVRLTLDMVIPMPRDWVPFKMEPKWATQSVVEDILVHYAMQDHVRKSLMCELKGDKNEARREHLRANVIQNAKRTYKFLNL